MTLEDSTFYQGPYRKIQDSGISGWYVKKSHSKLEMRLPPIQKPFDSILEVGGNIGEHIQFIEANFKSYTLSDLRFSNLKFLDNRINFTVADVHILPFKSNAFDRTILTCLLHHLSDPFKALKEIDRVTKKNGLVSILLPCDPGLAYRTAKKIGVRNKYLNLGITNPEFFHYQQHRNHFPGLESLIQEVWKNSQIDNLYWPINFKSWNMNLFTVWQIRK